MNKYSFGYSLLSFVSTVGALVALGSIVLGVYVFLEAPRGMEYTGIVISVGGFIQGLFLFGVAEIGRAILDGSLAQQELLKMTIRHQERSSGTVPNYRSEIQKQSIVSVKVYKGYRITKKGDVFGIEGVKDNTFETILAAEKWIDKLKIDN